MRFQSALALLLLLACPAGAAWGAPLSHEELSAQAIRQSPAIQAIDHAIDAAKAKASAAGAPNNPSLVGQLQLSPQPSNNMVTLGLKQVLDFRGLADQRRAQADEEVEILALERERLVRDLQARAREAYWQTWLSRTELKRYERDLAWQREELVRAQKLVALGAAPRHEVVDAELDLLEADLAHRNALQQAKGQLGRLNYLLGREEGAPLELVEPSLERESLAPLEAWLQEAGTRRPEPRQLAIARRREERGVRLAESMRFGTGEVEAQAGTAANTDLLLYGAFNLPLPLSNVHQAERMAASAEAARLEAEMLAARQTINQEVLAAYYAAAEAAAHLQDVEERLISHADHMLEKAEARLKLGTGTRAELLGARHAFSQAEAQRAKATFDYQLALLRLSTAAGR